jgi:NADPH:quinone reductase-like Zn-dependent oxidoreductase
LIADCCRVRTHNGEVKALVFRHSLARAAASAIGGRVDRRAFVSRLAPVRVEDVAEHSLPSEEWVRVETTFSGPCGSDVKQILLNGSRDNPLTALVSFPHVLGHEAVGRRLDTGERVVQPVAVLRSARRGVAVRGMLADPVSVSLRSILLARHRRLVALAWCLDILVLAYALAMATYRRKIS